MLEISTFSISWIFKQKVAKIRGFNESIERYKYDCLIKYVWHVMFNNSYFYGTVINWSVAVVLQSMDIFGKRLLVVRFQHEI